MFMHTYIYLIQNGWRRRGAVHGHILKSQIGKMRCIHIVTYTFKTVIIVLWGGYD